MRFLAKIALIALTIFLIIIPLWNLAGTGENVLPDEEGFIEMAKLGLGIVIVCPGWFFYNSTKL